MLCPLEEGESTNKVDVFMTYGSSVCVEGKKVVKELFIDKEPVDDVREALRLQLVSAMQAIAPSSGRLLHVRMANTAASFKDSVCDPASFPIELFNANKCTAEEVWSKFVRAEDTAKTHGCASFSNPTPDPAGARARARERDRCCCSLSLSLLAFVFVSAARRFFMVGEDFRVVVTSDFAPAFASARSDDAILVGFGAWSKTSLWRRRWLRVLESLRRPFASAFELSFRFQIEVSGNVSEFRVESEAQIAPVWRGQADAFEYLESALPLELSRDGVSRDFVAESLRFSRVGVHQCSFEVIAVKPGSPPPKWQPAHADLKRWRILRSVF